MLRERIWCGCRLLKGESQLKCLSICILAIVFFSFFFFCYNFLSLLADELDRLISDKVKKPGAIKVAQGVSVGMPRKLQVFSLEGRKSLKVDIVVLEFLISAGWGEGLFFLFMFSVCSSCLKTFTPSSMGSQIVSQKDSLRCKEEIKLKKYFNR